jgi:hypothetical protein
MNEAYPGTVDERGKSAAAEPFHVLTCGDSAVKDIKD